jgi:hypothetical protein
VISIACVSPKTGKPTPPVGSAEQWFSENKEDEDDDAEAVDGGE